MEEQRQHKCLACSLTLDPVFLATLCISQWAKPPLMHLLLWLQKRLREHHAELADAAATQRVHLGPTPLWKLVSAQADSTWNDFNDLLGKHAEDDPGSWGRAFSILPPELLPLARQLVVTLVPAGACGCKMRFPDRAQRLPRMPLLLAEKPHDEETPRRALVAEELLATNECCLRAVAGDPPLKLRREFGEALRHCADHGTCPLELDRRMLAM